MPQASQYSMARAPKSPAPYIYISESIKNENLHSLSESEVDLIVKKILENENFSK